jgi:hypothetical protein
MDSRAKVVKPKNCWEFFNFRAILAIYKLTSCSFLLTSN